jgi:MFS family permease
MAMLTDYSATTDRGKTMGTFNTVFFLGVGLGPLLGGVIASAFGPIAVFDVWAAVALSGAILCIIALRETAKHKRTVAARKAAGPSNEPLIKPGLWPTFAAGCVVRARGGVCTSFNNALLPLYALALFDATPAMIGSIMFIHGLGLAFFNIPGGIMSDRYGRRMPALAGSLIATVGVLWYSAAGSFWPLFLAVGLAGAGAAFSSPAVAALTADICNPARRGEAFGYFLTSFNLGMVLGALVFGFVADLVGLWGAVLAWGLTSLALSLFGLVIREPARGQASELATAQAR